MWKSFKIVMCMVTVIWVLLTCGIVTAQENDEKPKIPMLEETVIVTATRTEVAVDLTPTPITVIENEMIATSNTASVLELLDAYVPGVSISRSGPLGGQVSFRGFNSNDFKSPLFIDGDRFHGRNTLEYILLNPDVIERIEIIRGPAATMYGTDAMGGLINVITRRARGETDKAFTLKPSLRSLQYSSMGNRRSATIDLIGLGRKFDMLLSVNGRKAENYDSPEGEVPSSDLAGISMDFHFGYTPSEGNRLELSAKYANVGHGYPAGLSIAPGYPYKSRRQNPITEKMIKLHYVRNRKLIGFDHIEASMYSRYLYSNNYGEVRPRENTFSQVTKMNNYVDGPLGLGGKLFGERALKYNNTLTIGTDWFRDSRNPVEAESTVYDDQGNIISHTPRKVRSPAEVQTNIGIFAHNSWNPVKQWTVSVGGRIDYFKTSADVAEAYEGLSRDVDWPVTGSIGVIYRPVSIVHFTANVGTSFRMPIPFEKFGTLMGYEPTPELKPEKGVTYEVGARLRLKRVHSNLTLFQGNYTDLINRQIVDSTIYPGTRAQKPVNIGKARIRGVELDSTWLVNENWKAFMNLAYLRGTDTIREAPLSYIAPLNGLVGLRYTDGSEAFYIEATERWSARKTKIDAALERETAGFGALDLNAGINLQKLSYKLSNMELRFSLNNILDKAYSSPVTPEDISYPISITNPLLEPGRYITVSLQTGL